MREIYRGQVAVCKMKIILMDISLQCLLSSSQDPSKCLFQFIQIIFKEISKAHRQGLFDRRVLDKVSPFLSAQVSSLLTTEPQRRPTAENLLLRLTDESNKVGGGSEPQYQRHLEQDHSHCDSGTFVQSKLEETVKPKEKIKPAQTKSASQLP